MPVVRRVVLRERRPCSRCKRMMEPGTVAVKDAREGAVRESRVKEYRKKVWYHADGCPRGGGMSGKRDQTGPQRGLVPKGAASVSMTDLMHLRPSDVIQFSVFDHEETKLFGVMRDEMMERRPGEAVPVWMKRCGEVQEWNRWRSKLMTAVFVNAVVKRFNLDADHAGMFRLAYVMALGPGFLKEAAKRYGKASEVFGCLSEAYGGGLSLTETLEGVEDIVESLGEGTPEGDERDGEPLGS